MGDIIKIYALRVIGEKKSILSSVFFFFYHGIPWNFLSFQLIIFQNWFSDFIFFIIIFLLVVLLSSRTLVLRKRPHDMSHIFWSRINPADGTWCGGMRVSFEVDGIALESLLWKFVLWHLRKFYLEEVSKVLILRKVWYRIVRNKAQDDRNCKQRFPISTVCLSRI